MKVEKGARVAQGEVLGTSGLSAMNKEAGSHVHFEVRKDNVAVNPERYLNKSVTEIKADAGAAKATNASGKKLMTNLKKKRSQRARNQKVKQKTSLKKKRNQQAVQLVTKKKNRRKKKNQQMVLQNHLTILLHKNKKVKNQFPLGADFLFLYKNTQFREKVAITRKNDEILEYILQKGGILCHFCLFCRLLLFYCLFYSLYIIILPVRKRFPTINY